MPHQLIPVPPRRASQLAKVIGVGAVLRRASTITTMGETNASQEARSLRIKSHKMPGDYHAGQTDLLLPSAYSVSIRYSVGSLDGSSSMSPRTS
jgi:hypothetical protein